MNNIISIVTPSLNQGQYIERTIQSILSQSGDFFIDYIIADGGSTDQTVELIKKYDQLLGEKKYPIKCRGVNFRWWSRPDKGQSQAINQGLSLAQGAVLAWINSDDYYEPGAFQLVFNEFRSNHNLDLLYGDSRIIRENSSELVTSRMITDTEMINTGYQLHQPAVFFTKRIINQVGLLDETLHYAMDFDLWIRILRTSRMGCVSDVLANGELWKNCKSLKYVDKFSKDTRKVCSKYDKNPLSKRSVSMFFAKFGWARQLKTNFPETHAFFKKILLFVYNENMIRPKLKKIIPLPIKKSIAWGMNKLGYSKSNAEYQAKYVTLIKEVEGLYQNFVFNNLQLSDDTRIKMLSRLLGTEIGEAIYLLNYLNESLAVDGDVCEFGIAQGATSALMANEISKTSKNIWLFDSFEGLPEPSKQDVLKDDIFKIGSIEAYKGTMSCKIDLVKGRLNEIGFPPSMTKIVHGFIEQTIKSADLPAKVCFAYVDFDFYEPIKIALDFLDKVVQKSGIIIIDDYDFFSTGVKTAVDEFIATNQGKYDFSLPIPAAGHFCIIKRIM